MVSDILFKHFEGEELKKMYQMPSGAELAFIRYKRWIENGGEDLLLSGFRMTSLQMYWLCYVHFTTTKFHHNYPEKLNRQLRLETKYMHVYLKNSPYFREAFQCDAMTKNERFEYDEFIRLSKKAWGNGWRDTLCKSSKFFNKSALLYKPVTIYWNLREFT